MKELILKIPDSLDLKDKEVAMVLAGKLYEQGRLSLGQAATLAGYSKRTFMELLNNYEISVFNYSIDELDKDVENAARYHGR
jgi:predicted HTH domain antitoxin